MPLSGVPSITPYRVITLARTGLEPATSGLWAKLIIGY